MELTQSQASHDVIKSDAESSDMELIPSIEYTGSCCAHVFKYMAKGYWQHVHHYLNKGDAKSTSNMVKHIKSCWGNIAYEAAQEAKTAASACESIINNILKTGSITTLFERKGKGKVTYSHKQHTKMEANLCPFATVQDQGFVSLMKTGQPEYYIPSLSTVSCDVKLVFVNVRKCIACMLQTYNGELNFAMDV
ncbi:hypothetical protein EDB19DRAFT_1898408 [Suillus lakei]|nr:hypothetical protein EDB19DRAFT_1898408 [Suillus lakei]